MIKNLIMKKGKDLEAIYSLFFKLHLTYISLNFILLNRFAVNHPSRMFHFNLNTLRIEFNKKYFKDRSGYKLFL